MKSKQMLALLLCLVMAVGLLAGCGETAGTETPETPAEEPTQAPESTGAYDYEADGDYTYNLAQSVFPTNWSPTSQMTSYDGDAMDYIASPLYGFDYNEDYSAYELVPVMAAADPVDVTAEYVGEEWGIAEGETGKAFRIALNPDACWEDGTPITADTWVYSMREMLNPDFGNYRASNYYEGSFQIYNAKNYTYGGKESPLVLSEYMAQEGYDDVEAFLADYGDVTGFIDWNLSFGDTYDVETGAWTGAASDGATDSGMTLAELYDFYTQGEGFALIDSWGYGASAADWALDELSGGYALPAVDFEQVGIKAIDDYTLDIILAKEMVGFYIKYNFNINWLLYEPLYEECKKQDATTGAWSSTYGTSAETTMSCGPYKLTSFVLDQQMVWERNENWFGYKPEYADRYGTFTRGIDGAECYQFQTDKIVWTLAAELSTREEMFLKGQLDQLGLNSEMLANYSSSDALYFTEGYSTFYGIINSDYDMLLASENVLNGSDADTDPSQTATPYKYNKTILAIPAFRQALSLALDRTGLCAALYPAGTAAFSLHSNGIIADPLNSVPLNDFEAIRAGVCEFWGVTYGEGGEFATLDEAYEAITGYDIDQARVLVDQAVDEAIANGWMTEDSIVRFTYCAAAASDTETKWYNFFKDCFNELFEGTKLEGKFQYDSDFTLGNEFGTKIQNGECDTAWGFGWTGSALDPYSLFEVYVDGSVKDSPYQYDKWVDRNAEPITLTLDVGDGEQEYSYTCYQWWEIITGNDPDLPNWGFGKVDDQVRAQVLAALQTDVLMDFTTIPLMNEGAVQLKSYKVNWGQEENIYGVDRGGVQYLTYNYTDQEWADYCASQSGGVLTY